MERGHRVLLKLEPVEGLEPPVIPPYKGGAVAAEPHRLIFLLFIYINT